MFDLGANTETLISTIGVTPRISGDRIGWSAQSPVGFFFQIFILVKGI